MSEFMAAGPAAMAVLGLGALGAVIALALAGMAFTKRRVPLAAFVAVPILVCIVGALGAWSSAGTVFSALESAEGESLNTVALAGLWQSLTIDWGSRWTASAVLVLCAWLAGVGSTVAVGPAEEAKLTPIAAGTSGFLAVLGAAGLAAYGTSAGLATGGYALAAVVAVGGLGVAFSSARRSLYEHATRVAGMRFASAASYVLAVAYGSRAVAMGAQIEMFGPNGKANTAELVDAVGMWSQVADPVWTVSWAALAIAVLVAFLAIYNELGDIVQRFTLVDLWATFVLIGALATVRVVQESRTNALEEVGTHQPAREIFDGWGTDLPSAVLQVEKKGYDATPSEGGYGDVIVYQDYVVDFDEKGNPINKREWRRTRAWNGSSWAVDSSPLDCEGHPAGCTPPTINTQRPPLLAIGKGEPATILLDVAKTLPGKKFLLLMRRNEIEEEMTIPYQLAHKQLGFLPVEVEKDIDLKTELWVDAGYKQLFWGPTHWFGDDEDAEGLVYTNAVFKDTEAPGVHVLVSEKARVEGVAGSCLTAQATFEMGKTSRADRWCSITTGEVQEWREKGREVWPIPEPETLRTRIKVELPEGELEDNAEVDPQPFETAFAYESAAVADCQRKAHEKALDEYDPDDPESELAETSGRMEFEVVINDRGRINGIYVDTEKSKLDNRDISSCAADRFRKLDFDELPKRPALTEEEKEAGKQKPEPPKVTVRITYEFAKLPEE